MRIARIVVLVASLTVTASMARAQATDQTTSRAPVTASDIIDRMSQAERAVLVRLKTYRPLIEVYIQNLTPDEARGWVPTDDNYFLGQLQLDDTPTLRPFGRKEPRGVMLRVLSSPPNV